MKKSILFSLILLPCLSSCGNKRENSNRYQSEVLAGQPAFDLSLSDYEPSLADNGKRLIFISRRNDSVAQVMTYDKDRPKTDRLQWLRLSKGETPKEEVRHAMLSPDGQKVAIAFKAESFGLALASFDGKIIHAFKNDELQNFRIDQLFWSADSEVFAVGGLKKLEDGDFVEQFFLAFVKQNGSDFTVTISSMMNGSNPTLVNSDEGSFVAYHAVSASQASINLLPFIIDGETISFDTNALTSHEKPHSRSGSEHFYADASRVYFSETVMQPRVRSRWGDRQPASNGEDNIGKLSVTQVLRGISINPFESSDFLEFDAYATYEPANILSLDSTRSGELLLIVGNQYIACAKLNLYGNVMHLVHTGKKTVFPLVPKIDEKKQVVALVSDPCAHVDPEKSAFNQPFDMQIQSARISEVAAGRFSLVYETRLYDHLEILGAEFSLPNLETEDLAIADLQIENLKNLVNISNNK